jgi:acyl carrier protein
VGQQLGVNPIKVKPESDFVKELGADSLNVSRLSNGFGI